MSDLLGIGASGISVYQRALSTVSNNIANLGTDGYARQTTEIKQNTPQQAGRGYIGTGAYFDRVARQYDSFLEASLQQATSDLESEGATVEYTTRLLDLLGGERSGLTSPLDSFFAATKTLSTEPASTAYRSLMLRKSDELIGRINGLSDDLDGLGEQAYSAMQSDIRSVNGLATQLAGINRQLLNKKNEADQPPELLDQRDKLLRDLAQYVNITTRTDEKGQVDVSLSGSFRQGVLVNGVVAGSLAASQPDPQADDISFEVQGGAGAGTLSGVSSGSIAGYARFVESTAVLARSRLNELTIVLAREVNTIQTAGLDLNGSIGTDFFEISPQISIDKSSARGEFDVNPTFTSDATLSNVTLDVVWDEAAGAWRATDPATGQEIRSTSSNLIQIGGVRFQMSGTFVEGDRFTVTARDNASAGIRVALTSGDQIAAASLFRVIPGETNLAGLNPTVSFTESEGLSGYDAAPSILTTTTADTTTPLGVIAPGQDSVLITLDPASASSAALQILTRDGRHLVGTSTPDFTSMLADSDFFVTGSTYSDTYLNKLDATDGSYKDFTLEYGALADAVAVTLLTPLTGYQLDAPSTTDFADGFLQLTLLGAGGKAQVQLSESDAISETAGEISIVDDFVYIGTGSATELVGEVSYPSSNDEGANQTVLISLYADDPDDPRSSALGVGLLSELATRLLVDDGRDLSLGGMPIAGQISVKAVDGTGAGQWSDALTLDSDALVSAGAFISSGNTYQAALTVDDFPLATAAGAIVSSGRIELNGQALGDLTVGLSGVEGYGALSALDIKAWIDAAAAADVEVTTRNEIQVDADDIALADLGLTLNAVTITSLSTGSTTEFTDLDDLVDSINAQTSLTGVTASTNTRGNLLLENEDGAGANIVVSSSVDENDDNLLGISNGTYSGSYAVTQRGSAESALLFALVGDGTPADLNAVGLDTVIRLQGNLNEELGVFLTDGEADVSAVSVSNGVSLANGLRDRLVVFSVDGDDILTITDQATGSILAERAYADELLLQYQGLTVVLDEPAEAGDTFVVDGNNTGAGGTFDAQGNNANLLRMVALESDGVMSSGLTLGESYLSLVGDTGNVATQAEISESALTVLKQQATEARDRISGVSLDQEAADLIRFQQAYQASAQVMQVATRLFDVILQVQ